MALPKSGSSLIRIDGREYRWRVSRVHPHDRGSPQFQAPKAVIVQLASGTGQRLLVYTPYGGKAPEDDKTPITPALVEYMILAASRMGWKPLESGKEIVFNMDLTQKMTPAPKS